MTVLSEYLSLHLLGFCFVTVAVIPISFKQQKICIPMFNLSTQQFQTFPFSDLSL